MDPSPALALASPPSSPAALAPEVQPPPQIVEQISAVFVPRHATLVRARTRGFPVAIRLGNQVSMRLVSREKQILDTSGLEPDVESGSSPTATTQDDPPEERRLEDDAGVTGDAHGQHPDDGGIVIPQEPNSALELPADVHNKPPTVPDVSKGDGRPKRDEQRGDHTVTAYFEDGESPVPAKSATAEAVQLASTFCNEEMKEFMAGTSEPEVLESRLSKLVSLLAQVRAQVASETRNSELEQQVKELTEKLCNTEEELEAAQAKLRGAKAASLELQSAVAAINGLSLRLSATFVRLGDTRPFPPPIVPANNNASVSEAVKLLEDRVALVEAASRGHAASLARNSVAFGAPALLCRDNKGAEALRDAVAADTRCFLRSQGPDFGSLVRQIVDAVDQQHANAPQSTGAGGPAANRKE